MIIIRRFFSNTNEETGNQKKSGKGAGKAIAAASGGALLGAGIKATSDLNKLKKRINYALNKATGADLEERRKYLEKENIFNSSKGRIDKEFNVKARESLNNQRKRIEHLEEASKRFKKRADKLIPKVTTKGAIKGAAVGGLVGAGLYYGLKKGRDLVAKKDAQVTKKQKED
jgi:hypothetical protein